MKVYERGVLALVIAGLIAVAAAVPAFAEGTGDDPTRTEDVVSASEAASRAADDALFESWKAERRRQEKSRGPAKRRGTADATGSVGTEAIVVEPEYTFLWTPSHPQERPYWCGPATVQIISHYWGRLYSQYTIAAWMGTTSGGTDFSKVDDALRYFSGKSYWYTGGVKDFVTFMDMCEFGLGRKQHPIAADVRIYASIWPGYNHDHNGHIIPIEAYDKRVVPYIVRVNDPYDEARWEGGGSTYGHKTYPMWVVANGVMNHWRQAMVK